VCAPRKVIAPCHKNNETDFECKAPTWNRAPSVMAPWHKNNETDFDRKVPTWDRVDSRPLLEQSPQPQCCHTRAGWHHEDLHKNALRTQMRAANTYKTTKLALPTHLLVVQAPPSFLHPFSPCGGHTALGPRLHIEANIHTRHAPSPRPSPSTLCAPTPRPRSSCVWCAWPRPGTMIIQGSRRSRSSSPRRASSKAAAQATKQVSARDNEADFFQRGEPRQGCREGGGM
jgi:hypothetical protein